jgi:hypothetical protein
MLKKVTSCVLALVAGLALMAPVATARDWDDRWEHHHRHHLYLQFGYGPAYPAYGYYDRWGYWHPGRGYYDRWGYYHR